MMLCGHFLRMLNTLTYKAYRFRLSEKRRPHLHEDGSTFCPFSVQFQNQSERDNDHVSHSGQPGDNQIMLSSFNYLLPLIKVRGLQ